MNGMRKYCPHCNCSTKVVRIGTTSSGRQRYKCKVCSRTWTNKSRPSRLVKLVWHDYVWNNMPVRALAEKYHKHPNTIRGLLHQYQPEPLDLSSLSSAEKAAIQVIIMDTTYFCRGHGVVTIIDAHTGCLLYFHEIFKTETNYEYEQGLNTLLEANIKPLACVIDGRKGIATTLEEKGVLVQMCHFHMWQIVKRYLTNEPVLEPNQELKLTMDCFLSKYTHTSGRLFSAQILGWKQRNTRWLNEKHRNEHGKYEWSHAETRRAYNAIVSHARWLYTFEKYPELKIPRTSNSIEGKFGNAKDKLRLHHGYTDMFKIKIFFSLLSGE